MWMARLHVSHGLGMGMLSKSMSIFTLFDRRVRQWHGTDAEFPDHGVDDGGGVMPNLLARH